jgi:hypothetical protein
VTALDSVAPLPQAQQAIAATADPTASVVDAVTLVPATFPVDTLFSAPSMDWMGGLAASDNGLAAGPLG